MVKTQYLTSKHPPKELNSSSEGQEETKNYFSEALRIHSGVMSLSRAVVSLEWLKWCLKILTEVHSPVHMDFRKVKSTVHFSDGFRKDTAIKILARQKKNILNLINRVTISSWHH